MTIQNPSAFMLKFIEDYLDPFIRDARGVFSVEAKEYFVIPFDQKLKLVFFRTFDPKKYSQETFSTLEQKARDFYVSHAISQMHKTYAFENWSSLACRGISLDKQKKHCASLAEALDHAVARDFSPSDLPQLSKEQIVFQVKARLKELYEEQIHKTFKRVIQEVKKNNPSMSSSELILAVLELIKYQFPLDDDSNIKKWVEDSLSSLS